MDTGFSTLSEADSYYYNSLLVHAKNIPLSQLEQEISVYEARLRSPRSLVRRVLDYFSVDHDQYEVNLGILERRKARVSSL